MKNILDFEYENIRCSNYIRRLIKEKREGLPDEQVKDDQFSMAVFSGTLE